MKSLYERFLSNFSQSTVFIPIIMMLRGFRNTNDSVLDQVLGLRKMNDQIYSPYDYKGQVV